MAVASAATGNRAPGSKPKYGPSVSSYVAGLPKFSREATSAALASNG
jgi:hypothetical protein